jgi:hypothetical protein
LSSSFEVVTRSHTKLASRNMPVQRLYSGPCLPECLIIRTQVICAGPPLISGHSEANHTWPSENVTVCSSRFSSRPAAGGASEGTRRLPWYVSEDPPVSIRGTGSTEDDRQSGGLRPLICDAIYGPPSVAKIPRQLWTTRDKNSATAFCPSRTSSKKLWFDIILLQASLQHRPKQTRVQQDGSTSYLAQLFRGHSCCCLSRLLRPEHLSGLLQIGPHQRPMASLYLASVAVLSDPPRTSKRRKRGSFEEIW